LNNAAAGNTKDGTVRIGIITVKDNVKSVWWLPICWANNHAMCGDDAACWGFICIPKQDLEKPCLHDIHCKNNRCGDERGALWCVSCSQDHHCNQTDSYGIETEFCELVWPLWRKFTCQKRVSAAVGPARRGRVCSAAACLCARAEIVCLRQQEGRLLHGSPILGPHDRDALRQPTECRPRHPVADLASLALPLPRSSISVVAVTVTEPANSA
jgi:hypothetical protein